MSEIKVAHVTTISKSLYGLLFNQLKSLQGAGYEVVAISNPGPEVSLIESAGIRHIPISIASEIAPFTDLVSLWRLYAFMRREKFTIVHTHLAKPGLLGQLAARMARVPIIVNTVHGFYFHENMKAQHRRFYIQMEKIAACCSDLILSQNKEDIQTAINEGVAPPHKISYLGNGIDLTRFDPTSISGATLQLKRTELGIPQEALVVGFVGRLAAKRKRFIDFLKAGREVIMRIPQVRLLIVGEAEPGRSDAVQPEVAKQIGIEAYCHFLGFRPNDELPLLYQLMDVLVLPSPFEGIPRVVMEAAAMRVPVVASDVRGNRETIEHNRTGVLVPLGDVRMLANGIVELLLDKEKARCMGEAGHRLALERFDEQLVFERVKASYIRLLRQEGLPETAMNRSAHVPL